MTIHHDFENYIIFTCATFLPVCDFYVKLKNLKIVSFSYKIKGSRILGKKNAPVDQNSTKSPKKPH